MYKNLKEVLTKRDISTKQFGLILGISEKSAYNKLQGITDFTLSEAKKTNAFLNEYSMEYLFKAE